MLLSARTVSLLGRARIRSLCVGGICARCFWGDFRKDARRSDDFPSKEYVSLSLVVVVCFVLLPHDEREYSGSDEKRASEVHLCCRRVLFSRRWTCSHPDDGRWVLSDTPRCCCFLPVRVVLVLVRRGETLRGCARDRRHHECERWNDDDDDDDSF